MKAKDFEKLAKYEYHILKDVDERGELISIRFVREDSATRKLLEDNGYKVSFIGVNAIEYTLPNHKRILVKRETSSEGEAGTIVATQIKEVFDKDGNRLGIIWDTKNCGVVAYSDHLIQVCDEYKFKMKVIYLEDKYVEFFEKLKEERWKKVRFITTMTYQQVWDVVDSGKADEMLEQYKQ